MAALERLLERFSVGLLWIAGVAITLMMIHVAADVVGKTIFHQPMTATLEIVAWYYMVATVFLPVAYIQVQKKHLMVELFTRTMEPRAMARLEGLIAVLGAVYVGILFWLTLEQAIASTASNEVQDVTFFDLPVWPSRWFLPIAVGAMTLIMILQAIRDLRYGFTGRGEPTKQTQDGIIIEEN
ncbi:MAG: TRAP transporter small permease [Alphaproteobacteria bacterium]|nr:TRAP transporter small permease [Alphaproteobacteria bacterium]MCB9931418.1 TRAP transporter small permease [Alphaproteobacteria bacterium]